VKARSEADLPTLVVLGASTGGPKVLATILSALPSSYPAAVVVVQHVDEAFAAGLVQWLSDQVRIPVRLVETGGMPKAGVVQVARTNDHLVLDSERRLTYCAEPLDCFYRPSVDVFMKSVAREWPDRGLAAVLTGMGRDGAEGLLALRRAGWRTIAQDQESSTVWGMPRAAVELAAAGQVLNPSEIASAIVAIGTSRSSV
jgi:two-component system response regulator WspF